MKTALPYPGPAEPSWDDLGALLQVIEQGSLSKAARARGVSQPTLTRQIAELERTLGVALFERTRRGMTPTQLTRDIAPALQLMRQQAGSVLRVAQGHDKRTHGVVRISASEVVAAHVLPPVLAALRAEMPEIEIVVLATDRIVDLIEREADIALRMLRPEHPELIAKKVLSMKIGIYASHSYLRRQGEPTTPEQLLSCDLIGFGNPQELQQALAAAGLDVSRLRFAALANSQVVAWELVRAGVGIGFMSTAVGDRDPGVARVLPDAATPLLPMWLTVHREVRGNRRLRRVYDFLSRHLALSLPGPRGQAPASVRG